MTFPFRVRAGRRGIKAARIAPVQARATTDTPMSFFFMVLALSVPFYLLGAAGGRLSGLTLLPASALMTFVPMIAASILIYCQRGADGIGALFRRACELRGRNRAVWVSTALLLMPVVCILEFAVLRIIGSAVPLPVIRPSDALVLFAVFVIGAIGEELGWQGYAYPALRTRLSAVRAAVLIGAVWALWHIIPFIQLGREPIWIFWHSLSAVALRIIIVWLFENSGSSVFVAVLFHAMINVSWALFPNTGSYYDPLVTFSILIIFVAAIVAHWGKSLGAGDASCYQCRKTIVGGASDTMR